MSAESVPNTQDDFQTLLNAAVESAADHLAWLGHEYCMRFGPKHDRDLVSKEWDELLAEWDAMVKAAFAAHGIL